MKIRLNYHNLIQVQRYENDSVIDVPDRCTVGSFISMLDIPRNRLPSLLVFVNDEPVWNSTLLKEGDSVKLLVSAGAG